MPSQRHIVAGCLGGLALSLLAVGVESETVARHVVQVFPAIVALVIAVRRPEWGALAAIPIFLFWTIIVIFIWLYQLGLTHVITGQFTTFELVLTIFMAGFSIAGIAASARSIEAPTWSHRAAVVIVFALVGAVQAATMRVAFLFG
jgi:hypothetical protein